MYPKNKFLQKDDYQLISFQVLKKQFEYIYVNILKGHPSLYGCPEEYHTKIHWSRDWEYPWAIIASEVKSGERVLDCGCGGSPLLLFLAQRDCVCYGVDPHIFDNQSFLLHYKNRFKKIMMLIINKQRQGIIQTSKAVIKTIYHSIRRPSNLWQLKIKPENLHSKITFVQESLDKLPFQNEFFDKVFCISVIEHLHWNVAVAGMKEMARVLKKGGRLVITVDNDGPHVTPEARNNFEQLIQASGLHLDGPTNFEKPSPEQTFGTYSVVGFILKK